MMADSSKVKAAPGPGDVEVRGGYTSGSTPADKLPPPPKAFLSNEPPKPSETDDQ